MIDEKKLKKELDRNSVFRKITNAADETVYDIIDRLPKVGEWSPCSERLPETYGEYLISREHYEGYDIGILFFDPKQDFDVEFWKDEIDAWMPLPEPFEESEE